MVVTCGLFNHALMVSISSVLSTQLSGYGGLVKRLVEVEVCKLARFDLYLISSISSGLNPFLDLYGYPQNIVSALLLCQ